MTKYTIRYERNSCIGAAACVNEDPKNWIIEKLDNKANLIDGQAEGEIWTKEIDESELEVALTAAKACPVLVIQSRIEIDDAAAANTTGHQT